MNDELKVAGRIGAELGAAKAEVERLRGLLTQALEFTEANTCGGPDVAQLIAEMRAALSHQAEPTDTYTAVDMATAAAQGFRDGQAAVEPAQAQDEQPFTFVCLLDGRVQRQGSEAYCRQWADAWNGEPVSVEDAGCATVEPLYRRPAQTEQKPVGHVYTMQPCFPGEPKRAHAQLHVALPAGTKLYAAPIAQTAPRCQCCGYLVTDSEHRGCLRAAAPVPEQSGLVGQVCGGDGTHNTVNVAVIGPIPWGDLRIGTPVRLIPAPATPSPAMAAKEG